MSTLNGQPTRIIGTITPDWLDAPRPCRNCGVDVAVPIHEPNLCEPCAAATAPCPHCRGFGEVYHHAGHESDVCLTCLGSGRVRKAVLA